MTIRICGNSHVAALKKGLEHIGGTRPAIDVFPLGAQRHELSEFSDVDGAGRVVLTQRDCRQHLLKFTGKTHFDTDGLWGLCIGTHTARIYRRKFWSQNEPAPIARRGVRPITKAAVDAVILNNQRYVRALIGRLKDAGIPCFVVSSPPPRRDNPCFQLGTRVETVRYLDDRARSMFKGWLAERGVPFVEPPPETVDGDGFLVSRYALQKPPGETPDPHHANGDYGALMIGRILDHVKTMPFG